MIPRTKVNYGFRDLVRSVWIGERSHTHRDQLANLLKAYVGCDHLRLMPSGRGGLYAILKSIDHPRVIVPAYTCKAVVEASMLAGKKVEHVEAEADGFNIRTEDLEPLLGPDAAVIATHQFGIPCEIERVAAMCRKHGALLIEDCAASLGTQVNGKLTGTFGDAAFFSFDSTKLITVPLKGGFVVTRDPQLMARIDRFCQENWHPLPWLKKAKWLTLATALRGLENPLLYRLFHNLIFRWRGRYTQDTPDLNATLSPFYQYEMAQWQAAIALEQVKRLDEIVAQRRGLYAQFHRELSDCTHFKLPPEDRDQQWCCIRFPIRVSGDKIKFYDRAVKLGIDFAFSFTFIDCPKHCKNARELADAVLDIPYYFKLSEKERKKVVQVLRFLSEAEILHEDQRTQSDDRQSVEPGEHL